MNTAMYHTESLLGIHDLPWGYDLAADMASSHSREFTRSQQAIIASYRDGASQVQRHYPDTAQQLNNRFHRIDGLAASRDLAIDLENPLEPRNILGWIANQATDDDITTFADWNVDRTAMLATRLHNVSDALGEMIVQRAVQLVDYGLLPAHAPKAYDQSLAWYQQWTARDSFSAGATNSDGYCARDTIALTNLFDDPIHMSHVGELLADTAFHEATHSVGFTTGGSLLLDGDKRLNRVEESFVEHCTEASSKRAEQPYLVEPWRRADSTGVYAEFRDELAWLTDLDNGGIPLGTIGTALMSPRESVQRQTAQQQIMQRLDELTSISQPRHLLAA